MDRMELIQSLISDLQELPIGNYHKLDALTKRAEMRIRLAFGEKSKYLKDLDKVDFYPHIFPADDSYRRQRWIDGMNSMSNLLITMIEEINLSNSLNDDIKKEKQPINKLNKKVFIVHGHDEEMKQSVARAVEKLGLEAVILHEKANNGNAIIQKLEENSDVDFVIVLLSGDDMAYERKSKSSGVRPRARQNVVFELGYFIGLLKRNRVMALYREEKDFEMPTDYSGVIFEPYDISEKWKFIIVRELKACGFNVDANKLI